MCLSQCAFVTCRFSDRFFYDFSDRRVYFFYIAMTSGAVRKHKDKKDKKTHEKKQKKKRKVNRSFREEVKINIFKSILLPLPIELMINVI